MSLILVWDASPLVHAAAIDRLDVLGDLAAGSAARPNRNVTTAAVAEEISSAGLSAVPSWLEVVHVDGLQELQSLALWMGLLSSGARNRGEATVLAWAECHAAVAIVDDRDARAVAVARGADVHGVLWVAATAVNEGRWTVSAVSSFADAMIWSGARYPFEVGDFEVWATRECLLDVDDKPFTRASADGIRDQADSDPSLGA